MGSSFGASIMGTIYANRTGHLLPAVIARSGITDPSAVSNPAAVHALPSAAREPIVHAYAQSLHTVFLYAVPVAVLGLLIALVLPQVPMRGTAQQAVRGPGEGFAVPESTDPDTQLETVIGRVLTTFYDQIAAAGLLRRDGTRLLLTDDGRTCVQSIGDAWRD